MSRPQRLRPLLRRSWSFLLKPMRLLECSWTRWSVRRRTREQERWQRRLSPPLHLLLTPALQRLDRLELQHQEILRLLQGSEQTELLLEILNSLQPSPSQEIAQVLGLPTPPPSFRSSAS